MRTELSVGSAALFKLWSMRTGFKKIYFKMRACSCAPVPALPWRRDYKLRET
eukprot:IDg1228t1